MNLTAEDYDDLQQVNSKILVELEALENQGWDRKKDRISKYIDNSRILLSAGKLPLSMKNQFASYIYEKINQYTTISRNGDFYKLFKDDESKQEMNRFVDEKATNISSSQTVDQKYGNKILKGPVKNDKYTKYFNVIKSNIKECDTLINALEDKYNESDELAKVMQKELGDLDKLVLAQLEIGTVLSLARKQIDDRNNWSNYEKLVAQFLINVGETKAGLAKKLNYCSKYASIGIERNAELTRYWQFLGQCPKCKTDVHDFFNLQIERYLKGEELQIAVPLKGY